ncbi:MAG TPA: glyceraldehyde 3-phosphate dehydrogenase NAD-binding domain-containing protein [Solidesulfovibrio magneticus]|jgi:glyceraldehyde 3-phosphate dehydrogenase|nr:glyceraldehyde 3-phosphate dehydrogenase NAD-binding domain-containing protein [Solidesulfovibrio magneticus]
MLRIGLNGFGRIGRTLTRILRQNDDLELVMINDINPIVENMAYLLRYDSTYGKFDGTVEAGPGRMTIDGKAVAYVSEACIENAPWAEAGVDVLIDASGVSRNVAGARKLTEDGKVAKVVVTHSSDQVDQEIVMGVNDAVLSPADKVVSNSICDANAIAHVLHWIDERYGIVSGSVTTLHPWLSYQNLTDGPSISQSSPGCVWNDFALGRASCGCVIPKDTTAVAAVEKILPGVRGKLHAFSYRIPTDVVASSDIVLWTRQTPAPEAFLDFLGERVARSPYVRANVESLVSQDYERESVSAVIDMQWTRMFNGAMKLILWYDNEWGYSSRVLDLARRVGELR